MLFGNPSVSPHWHSLRVSCQHFHAKLSTSWCVRRWESATSLFFSPSNAQSIFCSRTPSSHTPEKSPGETQFPFCSGREEVLNLSSIDSEPLRTRRESELSVVSAQPSARQACPSGRHRRPSQPGPWLKEGTRYRPCSRNTTTSSSD